MRQRFSIHKTEPNTGVLGYSYLLDAPAGKHGFVEVRHGHLYFENGKRARFIGFNLPTRSNTPDHKTAEKLADRFASMGVNVIRLHAADAPVGEEPRSWSSSKESPLLDYESGNSRTFHPEGLDRFDYFVAKLKEKGIYLHIDLIVARAFTDGDGLDYPNAPNIPCLKSFSMVNNRLIELQKEYAQKLLCHTNPYTGLALIDDPAVMTIQINNEDSVIRGTSELKDIEGVIPYRKELQRKFNNYLLMKYDTRENLKKAWTFEDSCALDNEEDPILGTVRITEGDFFQPVNEPLGPWEGKDSPARYADYMEFGILMNRKFYRTMKDYLHSLGVKVPIVTSNLLGGAADVYGHSDGDIMENDSYFNHPIFPIKNNNYIVGGLQEYVSMNPLTMQTESVLRTSLISLASTAVIEGKPFILAEWNEYGVYPFHSTAFVHTVAYACLNDWDGLILYCHHTSEKWDDQPADEILNVFDAYNDPSLICQWGFMTNVFLKGLIAPAKHRVDIIYTQNDLQTLPRCHSMPNTYVPYVTAMRNVFLDGGESYKGNSDVAINAGFLNGANLSEANHGVYYAWSPYRDAKRRYKDSLRLARAATGTKEIYPGVHLSDKNLVFDDISRIAGNGDYRIFATLLDQALKKWGVLPKATGLVDGKLISETGEIVFDPDNAKFWVRTPFCSYFSGSPDESIALSEKITVQSQNDRISLALLPVRGGKLSDAKEYVLTALGATGMDETTYTPAEKHHGITFTAVSMGGKIYVDTFKGTLCVKSEDAILQVLDTTGSLIQEVIGKQTTEGVQFDLTGEIPGVQFLLKLK